jgi:teichuronic acid biosynthesis glycosyltransferase TuaC
MVDDGIGAIPRSGPAARPRVLVVTHLFPSGHAPEWGPWVAEQVDALRVHADVDVLCCTQGASQPPYTRVSGARVTYANTSTPLGVGRIGLIGSTIRYARALGRHLRANKGCYDIIHAHFGFPDAFVASRAARRANIPLIVTLHGDDALRVAPRRDVIGRTVRSGIEAARVVICVSGAMADVVRPLFPNLDVRVAVNGFDGSLFRVVDAERDAGILFVGLLVPVKNVDLLLRAYARLRGQLDMPLTIAGDGVLRPNLEELAAELGIADTVHFLGYRSRGEVASLMQRARFLALPSSSEGYPLVVAEALACGTPVVASRVGGIPEILVSPLAGTLIPPGDVDSLTHALFEWAAADIDPEAVAASSGALPWSERVLPIAQAYRDAAHLGS